MALGGRYTPRMLRLDLSLSLLAVLLAAGVAGAAPKGYAPRVERARVNYRAKRDFASLSVLHGQLRRGMSRADVERLLGPPDYSPNPGEDFYSTEKKERPSGGDDAAPATVGLLLDYRDKDGNVTDRLHTFEMLALAD